MVQALLMRVAFLAILMASPSFAPESVERGAAESEADHRGCALNDFWTVDVAGLYTVTSTDGLLPGTEGALRVIEFAPVSDEKESLWQPE